MTRLGHKPFSAWWTWLAISIAASPWIYWRQDDESTGGIRMETRYTAMRVGKKPLGLRILGQLPLDLIHGFQSQLKDKFLSH
jgi:hypothetical protein